MDRTNQFNKKDIEENKGISAFGYFGLSFVMPLWGASDSEFAQFHARQGMILALNEFFMIVLIFVAHFLTQYGTIFSILRMVFWLMFVIETLFYSFYGCINAMRGKAKELPLIGSSRK